MFFLFLQASAVTSLDTISLNALSSRLQNDSEFTALFDHINTATSISSLEIHPIIQFAFSHIHLPLRSSDLTGETIDIYKRIKERCGDVKIQFVEEDKVLSLEQILDGLLSRKPYVQLIEKPKNLHGVTFSPLDQLLHDLYHMCVCTFSVDQSDHLVTVPLYNLALDMTKEMLADIKKNASEEVYNKCVTALFIIHHETFDFSVEKEEKSRKFLVFKHLFEDSWFQILDHAFKDGLEFYENKKMIFVTNEQTGEIVSKEEILKLLKIKEDELLKFDKFGVITTLRMAVSSIEYRMDDARDAYWRLKYCKMTEGIATPKEAASFDRTRQYEWLRDIDEAEKKIMNDAFYHMKKVYGKSNNPIARKFKENREKIFDENPEHVAKLTELLIG